MREYKKAMLAYAGAIDDKKDEETIAALGIATINIAMLSTKNMPEKRLDELLSDVEMWELAKAIPAKIVLSEADKKKLLWQSRIDAANSVASATAESVTTPPVQSPPNS
jgi:hypothetical protein